MSLQVEKLTKIYGSQTVLDAISFEAKKGEILGFLGPNGAGKTTTMKVITGFTKADSGYVNVCGINVDKNPMETKSRIGYLPEHNPLYLDLYIREYLAFNADIYKVSKSRIEEVIQLTGLTPESSKKIGQLSKGYRQRVGLACALLHDPEVLILDEPTTGLDPNQLVEIRDLIKNIGKNKTVFLSTHIMQEVEAICDRIIIIDKGKIVTDKTLNNLVAEQTEQIIEVEFDKNVNEHELAFIPNLKSVKNTHGLVWELTFSTATDMRSEVFDFAQKNGLKTLQISLKNKNLEQIFREKTAKK